MPTRYDRQILLFGEEGQKKLSEAKVGVAGCGGLGTIGGSRQHDHRR